MNLISNNCLGGHYYKKSGLLYNNPFIWMAISFDDFLLLYEKYNTINFNKKNFSLEKYKKRPDISVLCEIDHTINLHYIHFLQKDGYSKPTKRAYSEDDVNILTCDAIGYCKEKYETRLKRMNEKPIFMYSFNYSHISDEEYLKEINLLIEKTNDFGLLLLLHDKKFIIDRMRKLKNNKIKYIIIPNDLVALDGALIIDKLKNKIKDKILELTV